MSESLSTLDNGSITQNISSEEFVQWFAKLDDDTRFQNEANRAFKNAKVVLDRPGENAKLDAMERFARFAYDYPDDFRGFYGMLDAITWRFTRMIPNDEHLNSKRPDLSAIRSIHYLAADYAHKLKDGTKEKIEGEYAAWDSKRKQHWKNKRQEIFQKAEQEISEIDNTLAENAQSVKEKETQIVSKRQSVNDLNTRITDLSDKEDAMSAQFNDSKRRADDKKRKTANMLNTLFRIVAVPLIALVIFLLFATITNSSTIAAVLTAIVAILPVVAILVSQIKFIAKPYVIVWELLKKVDFFIFLKAEGPAGYASLSDEIQRLQGELNRFASEISALSAEINNLNETNTQLEQKKIKIEEEAKKEFEEKISYALEPILPYLPIANKFGLSTGR